MRLTFEVDEDIAWLEIAMQYALAMGKGDCARDGRAQLRDLPLTIAAGFRGGAGQSQIATRKFVSEAFAFDQLHAEEVLASFFSDFMNWDDVRMVEPRRGLSFHLESSNYHRRREVGIENHFESHRTIKRNVA